MIETRKTTCNRDCPDTCSMVVTVEDGRAVRLQGDRDDPVTQGFLCQRTNRFLARQYDEERFVHPMLRDEGGVLRPVSWERALDVCAARMLRIREESGPEAILHYQSGGSLGILKCVAQVFWEAFGPVCVKDGDICSGAGEAAQETDFGTSESHDLFDLLNSRLIVLWGKNPYTSGPHLIPVLHEAQERGARIVGIDPVRTKTAKICDAFLQPRPGSDYAVAMGVARWMFDHDAIDPEASTYCDGIEGFRALALERTLEERAREAELEVGELRAFAELFGTTKPANIQVGWGMGRRGNGSRTVRAVDALGALSGNLGVAGGGVSYYFARRAAFDVADFVTGLAAAPRTFSEARLGPEVLAADPPVRMIWVTAGNPCSMLPDSGAVRQAFERSDFNVVVETHPTDTTDVADLVLPTLTLLEDDDVIGSYGNHWLRSSRPVVAPAGEAKHELEILQALAERVGLGAVLAGTVSEWKRRVMRRLIAAGVTPERLDAGPVKNPFALPVLFADRRFPTATGRVNLLTEAAAPAPGRDPDWPLRLLAASHPAGQSSQWSVPLDGADPEVRVHPGAAAGFADGAPAMLQSRNGTLRVRVRHDAAVHRDVALMAKGGMMRDGRCANLLVSAVETDHGGGAAYYDEAVRLVARAD